MLPFISSVHKNLVEKSGFARFCGFAYFICGRVEYKLKNMWFFVAIHPFLVRASMHTNCCNQNDRNRGNQLHRMQQIILCLSQNDSTFKPNLLHVQSDKIYRNGHETESNEWMKTITNRR